uniref:A kinase (PRKA) anchor protein 17A n=1 Tax=Cyprinus carpio TaxID=7962 RepID=A0A8C1UG13_CYPCA
MTSVVSDTAEAVDLCPEFSLYLKPISRITVSVALPHLKTPGKSISNWEVMERLKAMVHPEQFSSLRISKSSMDYLRFEGEVENRSAVKRSLAKLEGKSIKLSGFTDVLKIRAVEHKTDFPTRHDWDSFFRDAKDMNETVPGERPDTIHLEGLPCKWFSMKDGAPDRPSEEALRTVFQRFGKIRNVDIPMLDPYREEMTGKNFNTFSFGGHLNFEGFVQYQDHTGFVRAMDSLRGMKLMFKGDDGKAVACSIKVTFDTTKHLSDSSLKKRQQERLKLQELEKQREEQKRREKEEEERRREEERNLESIRLIAELLSRAKQERRRLEERRQLQEDELRRVEAEKERTLELQRKERQLRDKLLGNLLKKSTNTDAVHLDLQICATQTQTESQRKEPREAKKQEKRKESEADGGRRERRRSRRRRSRTHSQSSSRSRSRSRRRSHHRSRRH